MSWWTENTIEHQGARLALRDTGGEQPALLCLHGNSHSLASWNLLAAQLAGRYRVVAFDCRGHGLTTSGSERSWSLLASDVAAVSEACGLSKPVLVGHSMGARVAQFSIANGFEVKGLVAVDSAFGPTVDGRPDSKESVTADRDLAQIDPDAFRARAEPLFVGVNDEQFQQAVATASTTLEHLDLGLDHPIVERALGDFWSRMYVRRGDSWFLRFDADEALAQALGFGRDWPCPDDAYEALYQAVACPQVLVMGNGTEGRWMDEEATRSLCSGLQEQHGVHVHWLPTGHNVHLERPELFCNVLVETLHAWGHA